MNASRGFPGRKEGHCGDVGRARGNSVRRWCAGLGLVCLALPGMSLAAVGEGRPKIHDGMNAAEEQRALGALERERSAQTSVTQPSRRTMTARSVAAVSAEPTLLLMERRRVKGATERLADAWYYDYTHNETLHKIINLDSGELVSSDIVIGTQLPLIDDEIDRAFQIVLSSPEDRQALASAFQEVTGESFRDRSQVSYKAFVFHPDTVADGLSAQARDCGAHRCAQMLIYTHDNIALDMSPVVDLSTARVLENLELRAQAIVRREEAAL